MNYHEKRIAAIKYSCIDGVFEEVQTTRKSEIISFLTRLYIVLSC